MDLSGRQNLEILAEVRNQLTPADLDHWLDYFDLSQVQDQKVRTYSLGMRQRLGLIQAFMEEPDLLLLDEPLNALDSDMADKVKAYLKGFLADGKTLVMTSHHKEDFGDLPLASLYLDAGRIKERSCV